MRCRTGDVNGPGTNGRLPGDRSDGNYTFSSVALTTAKDSSLHSLKTAFYFKGVSQNGLALDVRFSIWDFVMWQFS